jgi:hypothetical protein
MSKCGVACSRAPRPARPRSVDVRVETVQEFKLQALVFHRQTFEAQATLRLGPAHRLPRHQAFGAGSTIHGVPEERTAQGIDVAEQGGLSSHCRLLARELEPVEVLLDATTVGPSAGGAIF